MLRVEARAPDDAPASERLVLPWESRCRSRLRARLAGGGEVGLFLARGTVLRDGDRLLAGCGTVIAVVAAEEDLMEARSDDAAGLARAAYHLGNRHAPAQLLPDCIRFTADHVLAEMLRGLGLEVRRVCAPFEPEAGAYGAGHGAHAHPPGHSHDGEGHGPRIHDHAGPP